MTMEITNNYSSYAAQSVTDNTKRKVEKASQQEKAGNTESTSDYLNKLQKQVPYMTLEIGSGLSMTKDNKVNTLAVNSKLLEKMQNDPEKAKEYTQRLKDIENAQKFVDGYMRAKGSKTKFSHWYVDENGNYSHIAYYEHDNSFYKKISEKSKENIKKHIEKTREKAIEKQKEFQEKLEEKRTEQEDETITPNKAEQLLEEKTADSKDGTIYLNDIDIKTIIEAAKEDNAGKANTKQQARVGANLDLQV